MRLLLLAFLLAGCDTETYVNDKYKFTCEKVETQKNGLAFAEVQRCENHEVYCYNSSVMILLFPAMTSVCFEKLP